MKGVIFGTAGHVDHGKTAVVKALTGVDTDRWAEEKLRGLTIDIGFAGLDLGSDLEAGVVDVPGHEDFIKNMLTGSTGIDALLLIVAADEGPMPQTREHLTIARLLGVRHGIVALNKVDRVDSEWLDLVAEATREEVRRIVGENTWPVVSVSAETGQGLDELRDHLRAVARAVVGRREDDLFRLPVDRAFSVAGAGTVVTGTTWSGSVGVGDTVRLLPADRQARVRSLQTYGSDRTRVGSGRRCALALVGVDASLAPRGTVVVGGDGWEARRRFGARLEVPRESSRSVDHGQRVRLFVGTAEVMARILTLTRNSVRPGELGWGVVVCERSVVVRARDRFVLRFYSPVSTIGGGQVADLAPDRHWRVRTDRWREVLEGDAPAAVRSVIAGVGGRGMLERDIPMATGIPAGDISQALHSEGVARRIGQRWYDETALESATESTLAVLEAAHRATPRSAAVSLESVRAPLLTRFSSELLESAMTALVDRALVVRHGPRVHLSHHSVALTPHESEVLSALEALLESAGLEPPPPAGMADQLGISRPLLNDLLRLLLDAGQVVSITPEYLVTREAEARARRAALSVARTGPATPAQFREALGLSRKHLIPLLEHMDRLQVTRRTSEGRVEGQSVSPETDPPERQST